MPNITVSAADIGWPNPITLPPPMIRGVLDVCRECSDKLAEEARLHPREVARPLRDLAAAIDRAAAHWAAQHGGSV